MKAKLLALILVMAATSLAPTPKKEPKPLDRVQVVALLAGGVPSERLAQLVHRSISILYYFSAAGDVCASADARLGTAGSLQ